MLNLPPPGLYRTTQAYPEHEDEIPANALVYVGKPADGGMPFVVRPSANRKNRWYWSEPTIPLRSATWARTLKALRPEGFYTLPRDLDLSGGKWLKHAIVQVGYNREGQGIAFVAEQHDDEDRNVLVFSERGAVLDDHTLEQLTWAPILPVRSESGEK